MLEWNCSRLVMIVSSDAVPMAPPRLRSVLKRPEAFAASFGAMSSVGRSAAATRPTGPAPAMRTSLYGAFFVKEFQQPIFLPSSVSLFDPKAPVPSSPTRHSGKPSRAGAVKAGCLFGDHPRGLALTVPSTAAPSNAVGLGQQDDDQRGARVRARIYRATTLYSVGPRTRTMMQSCASVAKLRSGGPILCYGVISHGVHRVSATSNRHRRPVTSGRAGPKLLGAFCVLRSLCGTQNDAVRHHAVPHESPQGDQKLARQGHDHGLASAAGVLGAGSEPLRQGAVLLEHEKSPRQLDHAPPNPRIPGSRQAFLAALLPALVGRASEARITRYGASIAQVSRQHLVHQHVGRLDANAHHTRQQAHHGMRSLAGFMLEVIQACALDLPDLIAHEPSALHV